MQFIAFYRNVRFVFLVEFVHYLLLKFFVFISLSFYSKVRKIFTTIDPEPYGSLYSKHDWD
jgi:hypothetical protein